MNYYCWSWNECYVFSVIASNDSGILHTDTSQVADSKCPPCLPRRRVFFGQNCNTIVVKLRTGTQSCNHARNQESDWIWGPMACHGWSPVTELLCLSAGVGVHWYNMTSASESENKWSVFCLKELFFGFILSFNFFLFQALSSSLSPASTLTPVWVWLVSRSI